MLNCIIIEDQPPAQRILKTYISKVDRLNLKATFNDVVRAKEYLKIEKIGLIFLDIHLPKISGIDFLKSMPNHPRIILTTAFSDYALESYKYNVVDYLLKPISQERFLRAITKLHLALKHEKARNIPETIVVKSGHEHIQIRTLDIKFIKSDSDYTEIITTEKTYLSKEPLRYWLDTLNSSHFCQVHKSYLINIKYLKKVSGNTIYMTNVTLPLGRAYKKDFVAEYLI